MADHCDVSKHRGIADVRRHYCYAYTCRYSSRAIYVLDVLQCVPRLHSYSTHYLVLPSVFFTFQKRFLRFFS